jgi:hypothetical protein
MSKAWAILLAFISASSSAYAETPVSPPDFLSPVILNEAMLDSVTAGAVSSTMTTNAFASGLTHATAKTDVMTSADRRGIWQTAGKGVSVAQADGLAFAEGTGVSSADTTGVSIGGSAIAFSDTADAYISVRTKAIDTRNAEIAIGHVRAIACCGADTDTSVQATTFTGQDFNAGHITLKEIDTPRLSYSLGHAVIVSVSHP